MRDEFYTPEALARALVKLSRQTNPRRVADFAVGGGSLLTAVRACWPEAQLHGMDVNPEAIQAAQLALPGLVTYTSDYLSGETERVISELVDGVDLIVLNPPFSCRGSSVEVTSFDGRFVRSSKAMAFILTSCRYMTQSGEILAIVPRSCLFSQKDGAAREAISLSYVMEDLGPYTSPRFSNASVSVHLIRITRRLVDEAAAERTVANVQGIRPRHGYRLVFMRGSHPVAAGVANTKDPSLIHTTDLFNSEISISRRRAVRFSKLVSGNVLMLPRVGRPDVNKIAVGTFMQPVVPSDCVICVKTVPAGNEKDLQEQFRVFWAALEGAYSGTCAPYLTMDAFKEFAAKLGFEARMTSDLRVWNAEEGGVDSFWSPATVVEI